MGSCFAGIARTVSALLVAYHSAPRPSPLQRRFLAEREPYRQAVQCRNEAVQLCDVALIEPALAQLLTVGDAQQANLQTVDTFSVEAGTRHEGVCTMKSHRFHPSVALVSLTLLLLIGMPSAPLQAQTNKRCFAETGFCIAGRLREFWEQNDGLRVFGLPITDQHRERIEGRAIELQWFERTRLELHPEHARPSDVQLGRVGVDALERQGRNWFTFPKREAQPGCRFFPETGHNVCGDILVTWLARGIELDGVRGKVVGESLALFGLPISDLQSETIAGQVFQVQWFERARFELHPEHAPPYNVLLGLLGNEVRTQVSTMVPAMVQVPAGPFLMGSTDQQIAAVVSQGMNPDWVKGEKPQHTLTLPDYWIGKTEVTNAQFRQFVDGDGYTNRAYWTEAGWAWRQAENITQPSSWDDPQWNGPDYPVVGVSWFEAVAYCRWLSKQTGIEFWLPSEAEWEKAARGADGRIYPWGNTWDTKRANSSESSLNQTMPVGQYPDGASPYGALDMAGNVWEWCATQSSKPYPYQLEDEWQTVYLETDAEYRAIRGGAWYWDSAYARGAYRGSLNPRDRYVSRGLRVASHALVP